MACSLRSQLPWALHLTTRDLGFLLQRTEHGQQLDHQVLRWGLEGPTDFEATPLDYVAEAPQKDSGSLYNREGQEALARRELLASMAFS